MSAIWFLVISVLANIWLFLCLNQAWNEAESKDEAYADTIRMLSGRDTEESNDG